MEWRSLEEFPNFLFSDTGLVKKNGKYLPVSLSGSGGYPRITLSNKFERKRVRIHSIIAELFIGPCSVGQVVRHLDDDPENNNVNNLAYGTRSDNMFDAVRNGKVPMGDEHWSRVKPEKLSKGDDHYTRKEPTSRSRKLTQAEVDEIRATEYYYGCVNVLAEKFGVRRQAISSVRNGKSWK